MPTNNQPKKTLEGATIILISLSMVALAACTVITWFSLRQTTYTAKVAQEIAGQQATVAAQTTQKKIPTLVLNQDNTQEGPTVTADPQNLGKADPFTPQ